MPVQLEIKTDVRGLLTVSEFILRQYNNKSYHKLFNDESSEYASHRGLNNERISQLHHFEVSFVLFRLVIVIEGFMCKGW